MNGTEEWVLFVRVSNMEGWIGSHSLTTSESLDSVSKLVAIWLRYPVFWLDFSVRQDLYDTSNVHCRDDEADDSDDFECGFEQVWCFTVHGGLLSKVGFCEFTVCNLSRKCHARVKYTTRFGVHRPASGRCLNGGGVDWLYESGCSYEGDKSGSND